MLFYTLQNIESTFITPNEGPALYSKKRESNADLFQPCDVVTGLTIMVTLHISYFVCNLFIREAESLIKSL
jgi:hypothetical protein